MCKIQGEQPNHPDTCSTASAITGDTEAGMGGVPDKEGEPKGLGVEETETADGGCPPGSRAVMWKRTQMGELLCGDLFCASRLWLQEAGHGMRLQDTHTRVQANTSEIWMGSVV